MNRLPLIIATLAALSIIVLVSCTDAKVPTTKNEISQSFSALAQLFSADKPELEANASTAADEIAKDPEALAYLKQKAMNGNDNERAASAYVLGRMDNPKAVEELCNLVEDKSKVARQHAYVALQRHNTPEARNGLVRAIKLHGPEDGLTEVICEVMDEDMWAATSEMLMQGADGTMGFDFDVESINELIASAKGLDFDTEHFDQEEFSMKMEAWSMKMADKFGDGHEGKVKIKVEGDECAEGSDCEECDEQDTDPASR